MLRRIMTIVKRDIISDFRDFMMVYLLFAPFMIAFILRALIPSASDAAIKMAVLDTTDTQLIAYLENYGNVERNFDTEEALHERLMKVDDIYGIIEVGDGYTIWQQGNESEGRVQLLESILNAYENDVELPFDLVFSNIGWELSPLKQYGSNFVALFVTVLSGMLIAFNLIEEKMYKTLAALNVAPISKVELVLGKGFIGMVLPIIHGFGVLWIMGLTTIHLGMTLVVLLSISMISLVIGFLVGVLSDEPISGIASMKTTFIPIMASLFGAIFLSDKWQWILYWSPFYWAFQSLDSIILETATWTEVLINSGIVLGITAFVFALLSPKIRHGFK